MVNAEFVPVWINVRETAIPPFPFTGQFLVNGRVDANNKIKDPFSEGFFLRSVVASPDGQTLLNPQASTIHSSLASFAIGGTLGYVQVDPGDYLHMLHAALEKWRGIKN